MPGSSSFSDPSLHASLDEALFDVIVIGGGVVGCAMARRFTLEGARVALVEKGPDILDGASKANSAILHTGFDAPVGSLEHACILRGYEEYQEIMGDLGLLQERCGAIVVAWTQDEEEALEGIIEQAHENGVVDVQRLDVAALRVREPSLSDAARGGVLVPGESLIDPWSAPYVYLRQALENGARVFTSSAVIGADFDGEGWTLTTARGILRTRKVINCAGLFGDRIDALALGRAEFKIKPRKGQFVVFDKAASKFLEAIILPVPNERTKGVVLFRTVFGNLVVGPTAEEQSSRVDASTDKATLLGLIGDATAKVPALDGMPVTAVYAGIRPATEEKGYRIKAHCDQNWITVGGIRSTGLSAALGIARHVYGLYENMGGTHRAAADPVCPQATVLSETGMRDWARSEAGEIVCHCELVTRREIDAALSGALAARSLAGLKRQTRATMGRCQGFYCSARLAELTDGAFEYPMSEGIAHE